MLKSHAGVHFVPLRKPGGDPDSHIGIFVRIKLTYEQASEVPIDPLSDTQQTNESLEDRSTIKNSEWNCSQTTDATNSESTHIATGVSTQFITMADVHYDNSNNISSDC